MSLRDRVASPGLHRGLGRFDVFALTLNAIIGAGVFAMTAGLTAAAGRFSILVLVAAFVLVALFALSLAEVASRYDVAGGPQIYARDAFGPLPGFAVGWLLVVSRLASFAALSHVMFNYAGALWPLLEQPLPRAIGITLFIITLLAFNLRGVMHGAGLIKLLTVAKLLPLVVLGLAGLWFAGWNHVPAAAPREPDGLIAGFQLALFACVGFEPAAMVAGEVRNPQRNLASGILAGLAACGLLYLLLMFACFALLPEPAAASRPLVDAAVSLVGPIGGVVVVLGAVVSCAGVNAASMLITPRVFFAFAGSGDLPKPLGVVHPAWRTPHLAIVIFAVLAWLLTITGTFEYILTVFLISRLLAYGMTSAALIRLRRSAGPAPVRIQGGVGIAVAAMIGCVATLWFSSWTAARDVVIALAVGFAIRAVTRYLAREKAPI